jgi:hypothetical protein
MTKEIRLTRPQKTRNPLEKLFNVIGCLLILGLVFALASNAQFDTALGAGGGQLLISILTQVLGISLLVVLAIAVEKASWFFLQLPKQVKDIGHSLFITILVLLSGKLLIAICRSIGVTDTKPVLLIAGQALLVVAIIAQLYAVSYRSRCCRLKKETVPDSTPNKSAAIEEPITMEFPVLLPLAWQTLKAAIEECLVKTPDTRPTVWIPQLVNEGTQQMRLSLNYQRETLGHRIYRLYPRTIDLDLKLCGKGTRSQLTLVYAVKSPMDYQNVRAIVQQTNTAIAEAMKQAGSHPQAA